MSDGGSEPSVGSRIFVDPNLRLDHVIGQDSAVSELRNLVDRIKYSGSYSLWGIRKPKAIALTGPSGTGKTFSVRALSNEVSCPLIELCYEDVASELYDEGVKRLSAFKDYVEEISSQHGHCLIFIDEAEGFFRSRFERNSHVSDRNKTNFFLRWLDGDISSSDNFTLVVTSNAWETVDPAMRRSGRFQELKYEKLSPEDVKQALMSQIELRELSAGRQLFCKFELSEIKNLLEITGADVKWIVDSVLLQKASHYVQQNKSPVADLDIHDSDLLVTIEELNLGIDRFKGKMDLPKRTAGFGRN